ncbi:MAG TPA: family 1 glycosylhydrolase [Chloroflexia bacterium]|nr:family 1 glycosylhydrolase [Chloroflexia bacterium]
MSAIHLGPKAADFVWASGIEDTFVPQTKPGHRPLDEYQLIGHYQHWREDLALARDLGLQALRWGVPWYRVEPIPGEFDWRWTDQVIPYMVEELGITPIIDLMHYGCPFWLHNEFNNPGYPQAVGAYAAAFAERYKHLVSWYTPFNEPLVAAMMCGSRGAWPPYLRGNTGYVRVLLQFTRGMISTVEAIKQVQPEAKMVHVEATGISRGWDPTVDWIARHHTDRGFLAFDLLTSKVVPGHALYQWLLDNRAKEEELEEIASKPVPIDVMGLNFYPQWSTHEVYTNSRGQVTRRIIEKDGSGFGEMVEAFYRRYGVPIMITETSARNRHRERLAWLDSSVDAVKKLRGQGVPVLGYTWFPLFTMIEWRYRGGRQPLNKYLLDLGVYTLNSNPEGPRWLEMPLLQHFREYIRNPEEAVGELIPC